MRLTQSIMKRKFASLDKPSRIKAPPKISPQKGPLKNISPGACCRNFTACRLSPIHLSYALFQGHVACQDFTLTGTNCSRDVLSWNQQKNCTLYTSSSFCPFRQSSTTDVSFDTCFPPNVFHNGTRLCQDFSFRSHEKWHLTKWWSAS